ncbi:MAG: (2Fe-2S)-binding protein [Pseudomonadota bacterium]
MFVCICYGITDTQIQNAVQDEGVGNMRDLKKHLSIGAQCGSCVDAARQLIDETICDEHLYKDVG